jgi:hypothetical protein
MILIMALKIEYTLTCGDGFCLMKLLAPMAKEIMELLT